MGGTNADGVVACAMSLSASSLTNTTSTPPPSTFVPRFSILSQRLIRSSISHCSNHFSGTSGTDLSWAGNTLVSNSSFSHSLTASPPPIAEPATPSDTTSVEYVEGSQSGHSYKSDTPIVGNQIWIVSCTFTSFTMAVLIRQVPADVFIKSSSFLNGQSRSFSSGLFISYDSNDASDDSYTVTIFGNTFTNNSAGASSDGIHDHKIRNMAREISIGTFIVEKQQICEYGRLCQRVESSHRWESSQNLLVLLSFKGVFPGTSRKYDVTLETPQGTEIVLEDMEFDKTSGTATLPFANLSLSSSLHFGSEYKITNVKKSVSSSTSNTFDAGFDDEPFWSLWHFDICAILSEMLHASQNHTDAETLQKIHTAHPYRLNRQVEDDSSYLIQIIRLDVPESHISSRANNLIPLSFTTPAIPKLLFIVSTLNPENLNEAMLLITVDKIFAGLYSLVVFDESDPSKTPISLGQIAFPSSDGPKTEPLNVLVRPNGKISFGRTYTVLSLASSSLSVSHSSQTFQLPSLLQSASCALKLDNCDVLHLTIAGLGFPASEGFVLSIIEVDDDDVKNGTMFTLSGSFSEMEGETKHILTTTTDPAELQRAKRYEITQCSVMNRQTVLDGRIIFRVPKPPVLSAAEFAWASSSHTTFRLVLVGDDLPQDAVFVVKLDGFEEDVEVVFESTKRGVSAELALGWTDTINFNSSYDLLSVAQKDSPSISISCAGLSLQTLLCPDPSATFLKKKGVFEVEIVGAMLIPCGLSLEVSSIGSSKGEQKEEEVLPLSLSNSSLWNETYISLTIPSSSLASLSSHLE
ncbi:hypothetical protein BLNAU_952 [Blattamonas nauphoetae]|uniref:Uncharacterized protein n=1 Tax=Blattamonas nauphoetae TaxID=2049346 RepID=A0ABQ9YJP6_9EUKA|nr:hypothetical protein BLNAU_952 [Blattamonas nauphoetae]